MSNGGTVAELNELVDGLVLAVVKHNAVIQEAEQAAIVDSDPHWVDVIATHRSIVAEHVAEIVILRAEIARLPRQRGAVD